MKSLNGVAAVAAWSALTVGGMAFAQEAVQWRVEDGGNGHWYVLVPEIMTWSTARSYADAKGGHLATCVSAPEDVFIRNYISSHPDGSGFFNCWLGALQDPEAIGPAEGWSWITGEPWKASFWVTGEPNDCCGPGGHEDRLEMYFDNSGWNDNREENATRALIEFSADCNGDGIVDYGQLLDGTLEDANENGVPDCCDEGVSCDPCVGDVNFDGIVNGADISVLLAFWGLNGKPVAADINTDGQVDGADLAQLLGSWGECP